MHNSCVIKTSVFLWPFITSSIYIETHIFPPQSNIKAFLQYLSYPISHMDCLLFSYNIKKNPFLPPFFPPQFPQSAVGVCGGVMRVITVTLFTLALTPCPWVKSPLHHPKLHLIGHIPLVVSHLFRGKNGHQSILIHPDNTAMLHSINKGHLTSPFLYISSDAWSGSLYAINLSSKLQSSSLLWL